MKPIRTLCRAALLAAIMSLPASAAEIVGGDVFDAGANATITGTAARDAFATGFSATLDGDIAGDGHAAGFDVDVDGPIGGNLYAIGASVSVTSSVTEDLTASGFSVRLRSNGSVDGNARITAGSIRIDGPITGSLMAAGGGIVLNAPVSGDVRLTGGSIEMGNNASIGGNLVYAAPAEIDIPASVIPADRVRFTQIASIDGFDGFRDLMDEPRRMFWPSFFAIVGTFIVTLAFLLVVAAVLLSLVPKRVEQAFGLVGAKPGLSLMAGFLAMALLFGLVPVSAMTLIGAPLIPIVILFIVLSWTVAYLLGAYAASMRIGGAFGVDATTNGRKLGVLAAGLVVLAILNFVPFLGWLINFVIVLLGLGAITLLVAGRIDSRSLVAADDEPAGAPEPSTSDAGAQPETGASESGSEGDGKETGSS